MLYSDNADSNLKLELNEYKNNFLKMRGNNSKFISLDELELIIIDLYLALFNKVSETPISTLYDHVNFKNFFNVKCLVKFNKNDVDFILNFKSHSMLQIKQENVLHDNFKEYGDDIETDNKNSIISIFPSLNNNNTISQSLYNYKWLNFDFVLTKEDTKIKILDGYLANETYFEKTKAVLWNYDEAYNGVSYYDNKPYDKRYYYQNDNSYSCYKLRQFAYKAYTDAFQTNCNDATAVSTANTASVIDDIVYYNMVKTLQSIAFRQVINKPKGISFNGSSLLFEFNRADRIEIETSCCVEILDRIITSWYLIFINLGFINMTEKYVYYKKVSALLLKFKYSTLKAFSANNISRENSANKKFFESIDYFDEKITKLSNNIELISKNIKEQYSLKEEDIESKEENQDSYEEVEIDVDE